MSAAQYYDTDKPPQAMQGGYAPPPPSGQQAQYQYAAPSMPPTAPYAEPATQYPVPPSNDYNPNVPTNGGQYAVSDGNEKTGQRFRPKRRFNDPIFAILFVACFIGFVVLSALTIRQFVKYSGGGGGFGNIGGTTATLD
ncbi:hypothetical protein QFC19_003568 [Naganishia cerealis]|uniref:Uncharacterized protein n=1 Tax=Naganishia cerealis TaxID=610337 RepID=A0ACC2W3E4_9TREE|nr:hypothetical protein QFC19_003568 [Naganishia cerealis]